MAAAQKRVATALKTTTAEGTGEKTAAEENGAWKVPSPLPKAKETVLSHGLVTTRSLTPSRLKSPAVTHDGTLPALKTNGNWNVPSPFPSRTETSPGSSRKLP